MGCSRGRVPVPQPGYWQKCLQIPLKSSKERQSGALLSPYENPEKKLKSTRPVRGDDIGDALP